MYKILIAIICMSVPALCMADDFNYDDETKIDVTDNNWDDTGDDGTGIPDVGIQFDDPSTGIQEVGSNVVSLRVYRCGTDVVIVSTADIVVPVYRIGAPAVQMLQLHPGNNSFALPHGVYIIKARKYLL